MRRLVLVVIDVNVFTGSHHQCQTVILKRFKSVKEFLMFLWKRKHRIILVSRNFSSWSMVMLSWRWACSVPTKTWFNIVSPFPNKPNKQQSHHSGEWWLVILGARNDLYRPKGCHPFSEFPFWRCKDKHISLIFQTFSHFFLFRRQNYK